MNKILGTIFGASLLSSGCALSPLSQTRITGSFADRAIEVNEAYSAELNAQVLKNILRARDRQARTYTSLSDLKLTPTANASNKFTASGIGLGNNIGDPWVSLGGERSVNYGSNLELTVSAQGRGEDGQSVYHNPISADQFNYYYASEWSRDLVSALLVEDINLIVSANENLLDAIDKNASDFRVFARKGRLTYCFDDNDCPLKKNNESTYYAGNLTKNLSSKFPSAVGARANSQTNATRTTLTELDRQGGFTVSCRQEGAGVKFANGHEHSQPSNHDMYMCSNQPFSGTNSDPVSIFYITRYDPNSNLNGIYSINPSSIDNIIYNIGKSLRPSAEPKPPCTSKGAQYCTSETVLFSNNSNDIGKNVPIFSVATANSLPPQLERKCGETYLARVEHHGETYYAGPPQQYYPGHQAPCHFNDRSGTTLTLLTEIIKLNQVNTKLVSSTVFFRN